MHSPAPEPATQRFIERGAAGCDPAIAGQQLPSGNRGQVSLEHGKVINRLAHCLFLICSQVRLRLSRVKQRLMPPHRFPFTQQKSKTAPR